MILKRLGINRSINLTTCVGILNGILKNHFASTDYILVGKSGQTSLEIKLNKDSKKELGYIIFDEEELKTYILDNCSVENETLDIMDLWENIENHYRAGLSFDVETHRFKIIK